MTAKRRRVVVESSDDEQDEVPFNQHCRVDDTHYATTPRMNNEGILPSEGPYSLLNYDPPSTTFTDKTDDTWCLARADQAIADQLSDLNSTATSTSEDKEQSDTKMAPGDEDEETPLATTVEYIAQLPKPKPHSVFVLKGMDKNKTVLVLPANISLVNGELYNMAHQPPAPLHIQLLKPPSTHRLSFEDTPDKLVRLLDFSPAEQHSQLGFKTPSTGDKASDMARFGSERANLAAKAWSNHTVSGLDSQSAVRMLGYLLHHSDHPLFTVICKSFQVEWTALVEGETFICGGGCDQIRRFKETSYTFELVLERAAVVAVARQAVMDGARVSGFKLLELLASPAGGNVVLSCQHCPNIYKGTITSAQQAAILTKIRL